MSNPDEKFAGAVHKAVALAMAAEIPSAHEVELLVGALGMSELSDDEYAVLVTQHREVVDAIVHELRATIAAAVASAVVACKKPALLN